ncbi:MAG: hypothetical protein ABIP89_08900 [Polyangiaceae bacterium]
MLTLLTRQRVTLLLIPYLSLGCGLLEGGIGADLDAATSGPPDASIVDASVGDEIVDAGAGDTEDATDAFDAPAIDAAELCPARCVEAGVGTCNPSGTCAIDCVAAGTCLAPIVCPTGIPCAVTCTGAGSCTSTIDCTKASSCMIDCVGGGSCTSGIRCSGSSCTVNCIGIGTCTAGVCCDAGTCNGSPPACL